MKENEINKIIADYMDGESFDIAWYSGDKIPPTYTESLDSLVPVIKKLSSKHMIEVGISKHSSWAKIWQEKLSGRLTLKHHILHKSMRFALATACAKIIEELKVQ